MYCKAKQKHKPKDNLLTNVTQDVKQSDRLPGLPKWVRTLRVFASRTVSSTLLPLPKALLEA